MVHGPLSIALSLATSLADTHYVDINSPSPTPPYPNWATAATVIQDAVNVAKDGDVVLVTNGVYETGGKTGYLPGDCNLDGVVTEEDVP